ncbi:MAG: hypothetical protein KAV00_14745 [Phycisphaerae bacterium]|nr:hypothetical protein [Phycisphaerae bacterium]
MNIRSVLSVFALTLTTVLVGGCEMFFPKPGAQPPAAEVVPEPINTLLPTQIRIHPFTGLRAFSDKGDIKGLDVRIEAIDAYGDTNKAFGLFRFELYQFKPNSPDPKGPRVAVWNVNIEDFKTNRRHWNSIARTYQFKLAWNRPIPVGRKFVLITIFQSRFTERLFAELTFVSER